MNIVEIIAKKRNNKQLTKPEIESVIKEYTENKIPDYQMSALLMAILLNGASDKETTYLTDAMMNSGKVLDFKDITVVDKHSTGGVGDKTSFILAPIAHACGVKVPMIAGRGLGHTGGTVDKIESIKGFNTSLNLKQFKEGVMNHGMVLIGQTKDIAPADKKIYALRDVTGTVESIPLITASIMSKKLAEGASGIVMDIKFGSGAFMKTKADAQKLAKSIQSTALRSNKNIITVMSDMNQPLGLTIGNSLEVIECIEVLKGKGPKDITDLSIHLAAGMIVLAGLAKNISEATKMAKKSIKNGEALKSFRSLLKYQGASDKYVDNYKNFPTAKETCVINANNSGYIKTINGLKLGLLCTDLGGGRKQKTDKLDHGVGFTLHKKIGDKVTKNSPLITIHFNKNQKSIVEKIKKEILVNVYSYSKTKPTEAKLIYKTDIKWSK